MAKKYNPKRQDGEQRPTALSNMYDKLMAYAQVIEGSDWKMGWASTQRSWHGFPQNISGRQYTGGNSFYLMMATMANNHTAPIYATFNQIQKMNEKLMDEKGRIPKEKWDEAVHVRKGEQAEIVVFNTPLYVNPDKPKEKPLTAKEYEKLSKEEKEKYNQIWAQIPHVIFNIDQTNMREVRPELYEKLVERMMPKQAQTFRQDTMGMYEEPAIDHILKNQSWRCPIVFDKETQTTSATGAQGVAFMERLNNRFVGNVSAEDIRAWLGRVVSRSAGVPKRPSGGIYIVPGRFRPVFELVQKLFESLGKGAHLYIERVYMGDEETANIQTSVIDFVSKKIGEISDKASDYKRKSALGGLSDEAQKLREINALFSEALDIQAFTDEVNERISGVCDTLNDALSAIADAKAVAGAKPSKTPLEVAEKVAEVLETLENGEGDFETIAVILKSEDFVQKPSTIERRVRKAVAEGFKKVEVTATGYKLVA